MKNIIERELKQNKEYKHKRKISKNFVWWLVTIVYLIATILNVITESYLVASIMSIGFVFSGYKYLKYRKNHE